MPFVNPEDEEFAEADVMLSEIRRRVEAGEEDGGKYSWDKHGALHVIREYELPLSTTVSGDAAPRALSVSERPYSPHPETGVSGTGGVVWAAALVLVRVLCERVEVFRTSLDGNICELGAGCGLPGLCAAALASEESRVWLTDESAQVLENLRRTVKLNKGRLRASVKVASLRWESVLDGSKEPPVEDVDALIGSDLIWGSDRGLLVAQIALRLVKPGGLLLVTSADGRDGLERFETILRTGAVEGYEQTGSNGPWGASVLPFDVDVSYMEEDGERCVVYTCWRASHSEGGEAPVCLSVRVSTLE